MSILWCGGEDLDFQQSTLPGVTTNTQYYRTGYARCALAVPESGNAAKSNQFSGGAVTSAWVSWRWANGGLNTSQRIGGVGQFSSQKSLVLGSGTSVNNKLTLYKYDGTTLTALAAESGTSLLTYTIQRIDLQITSYGATATVNVYIDGVLVITFTGDVTVSGMTGFDCTVFGTYNNFGGIAAFSEVIVADEDCRLFSLVTMAPNAAGDTDQWTGAYTDCNPITINDANAVYTNTTGEVEEFNLIDLPAGTFTIKAVKISARASISAGATATKLELGYKTNSTLSVGTAQSLTTAWACYERIDQQNPVTSNDWQQSEMNPLQVAMESSS
ncbi:MAG: hypothetical protein WCC87_10335 [Candidatus Korobacteraceae bacterium]